MRAGASAAGPLKNEKGVALILALVMLAVMSILGAMALSTSTSDLAISGNYRATQQAFYSADRAVEYAMTNGAIYSAIGTGEVPLDQYNSDLTVDGHGLQTGAGNEVQYLTRGPLPLGTGSDPTYFESRYYIISVTGSGPGNASARIENQIARIVPK
jgi:hypothetical protein